VDKSSLLILRHAYSLFFCYNPGNTKNILNTSEEARPIYSNQTAQPITIVFWTKSAPVKNFPYFTWFLPQTLDISINSIKIGNRLRTGIEIIYKKFTMP